MHRRAALVHARRRHCCGRVCGGLLLKSSRLFVLQQIIVRGSGYCDANPSLEMEFSLFM